MFSRLDETVDRIAQILLNFAQRFSATTDSSLTIARGRSVVLKHL